MFRDWFTLMVLFLHPPGTHGVVHSSHPWTSWMTMLASMSSSRRTWHHRSSPSSRDTHKTWNQNANLWVKLLIWFRFTVNENKKNYNSKTVFWQWRKDNLWLTWSVIFCRRGKLSFVNCVLVTVIETFVEEGKVIFGWLVSVVFCWRVWVFLCWRGG